MEKWDFYKKEYVPFNPTAKGVFKTYCSNMNERVNCPHCGKRLKFRDSFTSLQIQNRTGMGFAVCKTCYKEESREMWDADAERRKSAEI